jgi:hypothetical protein
VIPRQIAPLIFCAAFCSPLVAGIPGKHGNLFDGCPTCSGGRIGPDGMPLDRFSTVPDDTSSLFPSNPDGLAPRPRRSTSSGVSTPGATGNTPTVTTPSGPAVATDSAASTPPATKLPQLPNIDDILKPPPEIKQGADGYWGVSFANLASFDFTPPPENAAPKPGSKSDIPASIVALDGKRVRLSGYMLPIKMEDGLVKEFLLIRSPMMCCYGVTPKPTEWVVVKMKGKGAAPAMDVPLHFYGTLHVGVMVEQNVFTGIYRMDGEKVGVN